MRLLARLFSTLAALFLLASAWVMLAPQRPVPVPPATVPLTGPVDHIEIRKADRRMTAFRNGRALKTYRIALGFAPDGDKHRQGDGRTPEGRFTIDRVNPESAYHLSLGLDYPRPQDRVRAAALGVDPGGDIFIHGQPNQRPDGETLPGDWTAGCIALSDSEIRELYAAARIGTTVEILP
ncbi:L,D-transpeptidase [Paracoccus sp. WLY502]|uniref:L,D-transpeptidase family protein n=1 Tax=Paracoccus yibinensis TaxID=3068891 RepID=UPI002796675D|nr:L,D-transpeptidase [Paracoccus sp. WLY502]MDQ1900774.1 L,D-transpeptidase [Paracoccus sp. WLY502]